MGKARRFNIGDKIGLYQRIRKGIPIQTAFTFRRGLLLNNK